MRYSSPYLWLLILGLVPLGSLCGLEGRATASCGDYVHILSSNSTTPTEDKSKSVPCPCQGPNCHQQSPDAPVPTPPAPVSQNLSTDFILIETHNLELGFGSLNFEAPQTSYSPGCADSIFHPPR